jgi:predicted ATPase
MLTRLRFKNWRSLHDVEIDDLQPINVFIGANSSGKTNILDALYFLRQAIGQSANDAFNDRTRTGQVRTIGVTDADPLKLELSFRSDKDNNQLTYQLIEQDNIDDSVIEYREQLTDEDGTFWMKSKTALEGRAEIRDSEGKIIALGFSSDLGLSAFGRISTYPHLHKTFQFVTQRWQLLDENFCVPERAGTKGNSYVIHRCADNVPIMLDFMRKKHRDLYNELQADFCWLLDNVDKLEIEQTEHETRMVIREKAYTDIEAPTISAGTGRILAMLTAFYALDMRFAQMPGLVVIEEPDTALNPMLLRYFVEQLRNYVEGEHPRQVIMTTHNPRFLDWFKPEEVRIVERDEQGYTSVHQVPDYIKDIWLDKHTLGEVWMTRSLGGVPE